MCRTYNAMGITNIKLELLIQILTESINILDAVRSGSSKVAPYIERADQVQAKGRDQT